MAWDDEIDMFHRDLSSFHFKVVETDKLSAEDLQKVFSLRHELSPG
jgi:hypothetical protein